jgi:hypothetical protein
LIRFREHAADTKSMTLMLLVGPVVLAILLGQIINHMLRDPSAISEGSAHASPTMTDVSGATSASLVEG